MMMGSIISNSFSSNSICSTTDTVVDTRYHPFGSTIGDLLGPLEMTYMPYWVMFGPRQVPGWSQQA